MWLQAQNEPATAANGVLLPSPYYDPAAARIADLAESAVVTDTATTPAPPADESAATDAPEAAAEAPDAVAEAPETGNSVTTSPRWLRCRGIQRWRLLRSRSSQQAIGAKEVGRLPRGLTR